MRNNWRSKLSVLAGASALALSVVTATPALADEAPETLVEVQLPTGTSVIEGSATAPGAEPGDLPFPADEDEAVAAGKASPVASAKAGPSNTCLGGVAAYGVQGCFQHNGDIVWSGDTKKDGMSSAVGVYTDYGRAAEVCVNKLGVNTWATCNKDYRESGNVRLRVLRYDGDTGKFYQPESWSGWIPVDGKY
ncbi:hypothetical protein ABZ895_15140 [Streptomyces californicus]|uniref:hypothetical protein n=1 Tax=Streptomyces californicus TaxID=67351 RepID=UPI0033DC1195